MLIGTLRSNAQLQIFLENKFYYISADLIKKDALPIHYVALFQTPRIFSDKAGINYYGEVLSTVLIRRKDIHEVPQTHGNLNALYYRFQIKEWILMTRSILPKESSFMFEFTNIFLMKNVEYVPELLLRSEEEYRFYMELKRRTGATLDGNELATGFELGEIKVLFDEGQILVYRDGKSVGKCSVAEFLRYPSATFKRLQCYAGAILK